MASPADPTGFDHYRRGEPLRGQRGKVDDTGLDYYRRAEPPVIQAPLTLALARLRTLTGAGT